MAKDSLLCSSRINQCPDSINCQFGGFVPLKSLACTGMIRGVEMKCLNKNGRLKDVKQIIEISIRVPSLFLNSPVERSQIESSGAENAIVF